MNKLIQRWGLCTKQATLFGYDITCQKSLTPYLFHLVDGWNFDRHTGNSSDFTNHNQFTYSEQCVVEET